MNGFLTDSLARPHSKLPTIDQFYTLKMHLESIKFIQKENPFKGFFFFNKYCLSKTKHLLENLQMCKHIYNSEIQYPKGTPFTYLISWSELNISYYGVRYGKYVRPEDLWKTYFTSSTPLKKFRKLNGEPDIVKVDFVYDSGEEARLAEHQFLKANDYAHNPNWLNLHNGGKDFCVTEKSSKKSADTRRGRPLSDKHRQKISDANREKAKSAEFRQKMSDANRGKPAQNKGIPMKAEAIQKRTETRRLKRLAKLQSISDLFSDLF